MSTVEAGRPLDALIADKVMRLYVDAHVMYAAHCPDTNCCDGEPIPEYSTDIAAAWLVVETLQSGPHYKFVHIAVYDGQWSCWTEHVAGDPPIGLCSADTAPLAICLAALKAVGQQ